MQRGLKYWLIWIGLLPISLFAGVLADFPVHWILYSTLSGGDNPFVTPYPELPEKIIAPFFRALVFVLVGSWIAPEHKFRTAVILASFWVLAAVVYIMTYTRFNTEQIQVTLVAGGLPNILGIVGAFIGLYLVKKKLTKEEPIIK